MMKPIIFSTPMVKAILEGRKTNKKLYVKSGEDPLSREHLLNRLLNGISIDLATGCWNWIKTRNNNGYGTLTVNKRTKFAHRLSYELFNGAIHDELQVLHQCDNPACVNPRHLHLGTTSDNMRECYERGRSSVKPISLPGESNGQAKLTYASVIEIRELLSRSKTQKVIADMFGISQSQVSNINKGLNWNETNTLFN